MVKVAARSTGTGKLYAVKLARGVPWIVIAMSPFCRARDGTSTASGAAVWPDPYVPVSEYTPGVL